MTFKCILGLATFPIAKPVHGGQRRIDAIRKFYGSIGIRYEHACIYDTSAYGPDVVGAHDIPLQLSQPQDVPFVIDVVSGRQAAEDPVALKHFLDVLEKISPDAIQLEHPFMWPLASRILSGAGKLPLIYSSHNVEAPLKRSILLGAGVAADTSARIHDEIEKIELEACSHAELIICVSKSDRDYYAQRVSESKIVVVPNGVDRPPARIPEDAEVCRAFKGRFLLTVGSAYPPNIQGACELVLRDGAFHSPPVKTLAVCGGLAEEMFRHPEYQRFAAANAARVQFFPSIEDDELWALKAAAAGFVVAVGSGGGTSLKTAEALALGKWVVANSVALRGFENFAAAEGVIRADNRREFRRAMAKVLRSDPIEISAQSRRARDALFWDRCFSDSGLALRIAAHGRS